MTKICTLLELSLVVKKSYCDLELKSSQQYFNTITARRFTACHKPLAHRTHCWSFPRLQQQWQVFLLPLIHCKATILLIRRLLRHIFCLLLAAIQENMSRGTPLNQSESAKFPLLFKYSGAQSTWALEDLTGVISNGKKKPLGFGACEIFSSLMWPVFFPRNGLENNNKLKSYMWEKGEA